MNSFNDNIQDLVEFIDFKINEKVERYIHFHDISENSKILVQAKKSNENSITEIRRHKERMELMGARLEQAQSWLRRTEAKMMTDYQVNVEEEVVKRLKSEKGIDIEKMAKSAIFKFRQEIIEDKRRQIGELDKVLNFIVDRVDFIGTRITKTDDNRNLIDSLLSIITQIEKFRKQEIFIQVRFENEKKSEVKIE